MSTLLVSGTGMDSSFLSEGLPTECFLPGPHIMT